MSIVQMTNEIREAYVRALDLLQSCCSPAGFLASPTNVDNYVRVWARDGVITGLAALASGEPDLVRTLRQTLTILVCSQGRPHGEIPSNVSMDGRNVSYGANKGFGSKNSWRLTTGRVTLSLTIR
jgi:hypothetical protein